MIELAPNDARKPSNELMTCINIQLRNQHVKYLDIHIGDIVRICNNKRFVDKPHVSKWSNETHRK